MTKHDLDLVASAIAGAVKGALLPRIKALEEQFEAIKSPPARVAPIPAPANSLTAKAPKSVVVDAGNPSSRSRQRGSGVVYAGNPTLTRPRMKNVVYANDPVQPAPGRKKGVVYQR